MKTEMVNKREIKIGDTVVHNGSFALCASERLASMNLWACYFGATAIV